MFIRWSGNGIAAPLIIGIGMFGVSSVTRAVYGASYVAGHPSVPWLGLVLGGFLCWWIGCSLDNDEPRELVDERSRKRVVPRKSHTLYGVPMQWWGVAAMLGGLFLAVKGSPLPAEFSRLGSGWSSPAANPATDPAPGAAGGLQQIPAATVVSSEQMAVRLYPALGVAGSTFNKRFLALHKKYRTERPAYFRDPDWPMTLAREVAESNR